MSDPSKPRYVPSRNRRNKQQRFHGAFTGGFSAGFFNTVGSKEGWKPRDASDQKDALEHDDDEAAEEIVARPFPPQPQAVSTRIRQRPQQRLEDFMDEQDHDEWGGPTSIRKEYSSDPTAAAAAASKNNNTPLATTKISTMTSDRDDVASMEQQQWSNITVEPPAHVGHRLLRVLGWREGNSAAYVPDHTTTTSNNRPAIVDGGEDDQLEAKVVLSSKKLRKVQLQQQRVKIPPPKLDTCGLGFEPYQNAPEFQAYQDKRRKLAQQRAKLDHSANVYRVSDVLGEGDAADPSMNKRQDTPSTASHRRHPPKGDDPDDDAYVSYETVEDFVGKKSVGGFALREDDDQAYDDDPMTLTKVSDKVRLDTDAYNNEIYEHSSDDDDDDDDDGNHDVRHCFQATQQRASTTTNKAARTNNHKKGSDFAGVLSSFADTGAGGSSSSRADNASKAGGVTADGRSPLTGFVLGGTFASHSMPKRYRGPDVPLSYQVTRHAFGHDEHPLVLKALSRAVQLEAVDEKRRQALEEALRTNAASNAPSRRLQLKYNGNSISNSSSKPVQRSEAPMAGGAFVGLAQAMKNRFTSVVEDSNGKKVESGLRIPSKEKVPTNLDAQSTSSVTEANENAGATSVKPEIKITRTTHPFAPHRLLCKRFHVPVPASSSHATTTGSDRVTEASYFHQEILQPAAVAGSANKKQTEANKDSTKTQQSNSMLSTLFNEDGTMKDDSVAVAKTAEVRPSMEIYKSIFEPQSDEDEDSGTEDEAVHKTEHNTNAPHEMSNNGQKDPAPKEPAANLASEKSDNQRVGSAIGSDNEASDDKETGEFGVVPYKERDKKKKRKKRSKSKKRSRDRKHRSRDSDSVDDGSKHKDRKRRKRSSSVSSDSTDLDRDTSSDRSEHRDKRRRHRDRKDRRKKKKKSKRAD